MMKIADTIARERATQDLVDRARERENDDGAAQRRSGLEVVARLLSKEARMLSKVGSPEDNEAALALAKALRDPERVRAFVGA